MIVRPAGPGDAASVAAIYAPYVTDTFVSFEDAAPDAAEMARRMASGEDLYPWLLAEGEGRVLGYASASAFRARAAYRYTVETSVYLAMDACGRGLGRLLYGRLLALLERQGFAQAIGAVTLPNPASARLHEALGFTAAGVYRDVGWKCGGWRSVGLWQRALAPAGAAGGAETVRRNVGRDGLTSSMPAWALGPIRPAASDGCGFRCGIRAA